MNAERLKNSILQQAIEGKLVEQRPEEGTAKELLAAIKAEKARLVKEGKIKKEKPLPPITAEEVPFEIPGSWEWVRLGEIGDWSAGATPSRDNPAYYNGNIPWLKTGDLNDSNITEIPESITQEALYNTSVRLNPVGSVLMAMYGATIGKLGILSIPATTNQACCACIPCNGIYNKYLFYFLMGERRNFVKLGAGGAQPNISRGKIVNYLLPLPPLAEQKRIVAKIEELLPHIEQYGKAHDALTALNEKFPDAIKKSVLQYAMEGKLVEQRAEEGTAKELLAAIKAEKARLVKEGKIKKEKPLPPITAEEVPFEIPESLEWVRLGEIIQISSGDGLTSKDMTSGKIPVYGGNGITGYHNVANIAEETVVIGRVGFYCGSVHVTPHSAWVTDNAFITNYPQAYMNREYLVYTLRHMNLGRNNNATAQPVVSGKKIYPLLFPLPPLAEQKRIVAKIEELLACCGALGK